MHVASHEWRSDELPATVQAGYVFHARLSEQTRLGRSKKVGSESVYCDLKMTIEEAVEMLDALRELLDAGLHPALDGTFRDMQTQIKDSISYAASERVGLIKSKPRH